MTDARSKSLHCVSSLLVNQAVSAWLSIDMEPLYSKGSRLHACVKAAGAVMCSHGADAAA